MAAKTYQVNNLTKRYDYLLLLVVVALVAIGLFSVFSASAYKAQVAFNSSTYYLKRQSFYAVIGFMAMFAGMRIDLYQLRTLLKPAFYITTFLLIATYIPFLGGTTIKGANNWIRLPFVNFGFQPSEIVKITLIVFTANLLANPEYQGLKLLQKLICLSPILALIVIVVFQPDMGTAGVIMIAIFAIFFAAGLRYIKIILTLGAIGILAYLMILDNPYMLDRIMSFLNPWVDPQGKGFQLIQSLMAIGSGGVVGNGLGQGMQKLFYLPESHTDFIFSVLCEESGLLGAMVLLLLIFMLAQRGFSIAVKSSDLFVKLLATGITSLICGQALLNIGVATGSVPTTGITLPFISYGGTSLIITLFCMGLLLNASRYTISKWELLEGKQENLPEL